MTLIERAAARFSRRQALGRGALAVAGLASGGLLDPRLALALGSSGPRPIPGGFDQSQMPVPKNPFVHVLIPGIGFEMSTITAMAAGGISTRTCASCADRMSI